MSLGFKPGPRQTTLIVGGKTTIRQGEFHSNFLTARSSLFPVKKLPVPFLVKRSSWLVGMMRMGRNPMNKFGGEDIHQDVLETERLCFLALSISPYQWFNTLSISPFSQYSMFFRVRSWGILQMNLILFLERVT